jgi:hypothetical protein
MSIMECEVRSRRERGVEDDEEEVDDKGTPRRT